MSKTLNNTCILIVDAASNLIFHCAQQQFGHVTSGKFWNKLWLKSNVCLTLSWLFPLVILDTSRYRSFLTWKVFCRWTTGSQKPPPAHNHSDEAWTRNSQNNQLRAIEWGLWTPDADLEFTCWYQATDASRNPYINIYLPIYQPYLAINPQKTCPTNYFRIWIPTTIASI